MQPRNPDLDWTGRGAWPRHPDYRHCLRRYQGENGRAGQATQAEPAERSSVTC